MTSVADKRAIRVLGVDPGTRVMGYGLLDFGDEALRCVAWGTLLGGPSREIGDRLHELHTGLRNVVARWAPDQLAIEEPFVSAQRGAKSAVAVGQAQAVALLVAAQCGLTVHRYLPASVKRAVANYGGGAKEQVQRSVRLLLGLGVEPMPEDASDAIAVALCHAQQLRAAQRLAQR